MKISLLWFFATAVFSVVLLPSVAQAGKGCLSYSAERLQKKAKPYKRSIERYAKRYDVDANLIRAVIAIESCYQVKAKSHKNAQGLMQLIPATADRFGIKNVYSASQNIRGGTRYLAWLWKYFDGDIKKVLAGYNAGEGNVNKYNGIPPFKETRNYVKNVLKVYGRLNNEKSKVIIADIEGVKQDKTKPVKKTEKQTSKLALQTPSKSAAPKASEKMAQQAQKLLAQEQEKILQQQQRKLAQQQEQEQALQQQQQALAQKQKALQQQQQALAQQEQAIKQQEQALEQQIARQQEVDQTPSSPGLQKLLERQKALKQKLARQKQARERRLAQQKANRPRRLVQSQAGIQQPRPLPLTQPRRVPVQVGQQQHRQPAKPALSSAALAQQQKQQRRQRQQQQARQREKQQQARRRAALERMPPKQRARYLQQERQKQQRIANIQRQIIPVVAPSRTRKAPARQRVPRQAARQVPNPAARRAPRRVQSPQPASRVSRSYRTVLSKPGRAGWQANKARAPHLYKQ